LHPKEGDEMSKFQVSVKPKPTNEAEGVQAAQQDESMDSCVKEARLEDEAVGQRTTTTTLEVSEDNGEPSATTHATRQEPRTEDKEAREMGR